MKPERLSVDRISTLPPPIIHTILCLLPIEEAVRTSILSKEWRYHWTKIPQLFFHEWLFKGSAAGTDQISIPEQTFKFPLHRTLMIKRCKFYNAINQVLLLHQGPLLEFSLIANAGEICVEMDQIISHLSKRNTVKVLSLYMNWYYRLPLSIFSLRQLTSLVLSNVCIYHQPTFNGFGSLTTLSLHDVKIPTKTLVHLVSRCPLLKRFTLLITEDVILANDKSSITDLLECLPVIERLTACPWVSHFFFVDSLPQKLPISLVHLKYLRIDEMCFIDSGGLRLLFHLIRCSPNLEKLILEIREYYDTDPESEYLVIESSKADPIILESYSDIWLKNLKVLKIYEFVGVNLNLEFVQLILAKSPMLKKVLIWLADLVTDDQASNISRILLHSPRASVAAKIIVKM